ncbi:MAG: leucyl/phenylalanyl-tRNA--protein transferase [Ignavibacteriaceae bacterium]
MNKNQKFNQELFLEPGNMLRLYARGAFPMADEKTGEISWYLPEIRTIIPLDNYNFPHSLRKSMDKTGYEVRYDFDFLSVVKACADRENTWISEELIKAYLRLYSLRHVHTVEIYQQNKLIGGLYGITFKGAFFGESMFSKISQASKIALIKLIEHLNKKNFTLLDVQYLTPHLKMFGASEISFEEYNRLLLLAYQNEADF